MSDEATARRRRRRRATSVQGPPPTVAPPTAQSSDGAQAQTKEDNPEADSPKTTTSHAEPGKRRRPPPRDQGERGLRDLVGAGASQLGVGGAMRGRDVNRPTAEDLEAAERDVVIVRRNWRPDDRRD